jgi:hypothetical protein
LKVGGAKTGEGIVRLFKCSSSGARVEIRRTIVLLSDDLDESEQFNWHRWNSADRLYAQIIQNLLSAPNTPELLVAWYATLEYASKVLAVNSEFQNLDLTGEPIVLTAESILERPKTKKREDGSRFLGFSGAAIPCFLLGELQRNPSTINSVRERIREKTINYLEQLQFSPSVIRTVQNEIDRIDSPFLLQHELWIKENPNAFARKWCNYFRNLDASDLSLFRP